MGLGSPSSVLKLRHSPECPPLYAIHCISATLADSTLPSDFRPPCALRCDQGQDPTRVPILSNRRRDSGHSICHLFCWLLFHRRNSSRYKRSTFSMGGK